MWRLSSAAISSSRETSGPGRSIVAGMGITSLYRCTFMTASRLPFARVNHCAAGHRTYANQLVHQAQCVAPAVVIRNIKNVSRLKRNIRRLPIHNSCQLHRNLLLGLLRIDNAVDVGALACVLREALRLGDGIQHGWLLIAPNRKQSRFANIAHDGEVTLLGDPDLLSPVEGKVQLR